MLIHAILSVQRFSAGLCPYHTFYDPVCYKKTGIIIYICNHELVIIAIIIKMDHLFLKI